MNMKSSGLLIIVALLLSACGTTAHKPGSTRPAAPVSEAKVPGSKPPARGGYLPGDGPGANIPANLENTPDAVPVNEPLHPYANRPYVALGNNYSPLSETGQYKARGTASWYGKKFHGQRTSSGEEYDMYKMTAAHPTLPIPSYARVTHLGSQRTVVVKINDRGPFLHNRLIDLSYAAATKLGIIGNGNAEVEVESLLASNYQPPLVHASGRTFALQETNSVTSTPLAPADQPPTPVHAPLPVVVSHTADNNGDHFLQLGARNQEGAESFRAKMESELSVGKKKLSLYAKNDGLVRVHLGPYPSDETARAEAQNLESQLGFRPLVSKR
jgi:rare lipoprotein A